MRVGCVRSEAKGALAPTKTTNFPGPVNRVLLVNALRHGCTPAVACRARHAGMAWPAAGGRRSRCCGATFCGRIAGVAHSMEPKSTLVQTGSAICAGSSWAGAAMVSRTCPPAMLSKPTPSKRCSSPVSVLGVALVGLNVVGHDRSALQAANT